MAPRAPAPRYPPSGGVSAYTPLSDAATFDLGDDPDDAAMDRQRKERYRPRVDTGAPSQAQAGVRERSRTPARRRSPSPGAKHSPPPYGAQSPSPRGHSRSTSVCSHTPTTPTHAHSRGSSRPNSRPPSRGAPNAPLCAMAAQALHAQAASGAPTPCHAPPRAALAWRVMQYVKPWIPILAYGATSLGFVLAMALWRTQVFTGLDQLSNLLKRDGLLGYLILYSMIFVTTIPPLPLYSTLIVLSGYTFGAFRGLLVSYAAALTGALAVFLASRYLFRNAITRWFAQFVSLKRVVRAIERRPQLLFLIRLAPYPYNVMNCLLAASPTLTLKTYTLCTALSLFKLLIHTTIGSTIKSFADYHLKRKGADGSTGGDAGAGAGTEPAADEEADEGATLTRVSTGVGIVLCIAIFVYLSYVARKAVDSELGDEDGAGHDSQETLGFLAARDSDGADEADGEHERGHGRGHERESADGQIAMAESPFRIPLQHAASTASLPRPVSRSSSGGSGRFEHGGREEADVGLSPR